MENSDEKAKVNEKTLQEVQMTSYTSKVGP